MQNNQEVNKKNAIAFYRTAYLGALVALHTHQAWPGNEEYVTMDFFRFDADGKIIEHWDAIQEVPIETKNGNPMYWIRISQCVAGDSSNS